MMSLVAYGSSDESGNESDTNVQDRVKPKISPEESSVRISEKDLAFVTDSTVSSQSVSRKKDDDGFEDTILENKDPMSSKSRSLLSNLPAPKAENPEVATNTAALLSNLPAPKTQSPLVISDFILQPTKDVKGSRKRGPVKITIPSLSDLADEEDQPPTKKKIQPSQTGSGLFALLPPPKHLTLKETKRSLVPNSVTRKPVPPPKTKKPPLQQITKPAQKSSLTSYTGSDSESDEEQSDFFSLNKEDVLPVVPVLPVPDVALLAGGGDGQAAHSDALVAAYEGTSQAYQTPAGPFHYQENTLQDTSLGDPEPQADSGQDYIAFSGSDLQLDEEALQQLCGRQGKRRKEEMKIVDVSGDAIMPDQREWLTKQLTEEQPRHSSSRNKLNGPSQQQRRKHQITYLAHIAKENELELKNSWANNRQTRKQTQSKYGF